MTSSTTQSQKDILLDFMKKYPSMATNCPATTSSGRDNTNKHWEELTELLNTNGPPIKTLKAWKKTWADYKHRAKSKLAKNKVFLNKTGGGPFEEKKLSAFEEATIELGKLEAAVAGIDGAKSFCGEPRQQESPKRPSTSKTAGEDVENLLKELMSDSYSSSSDENCVTPVPLLQPKKLNTIQTTKAGSNNSNQPLPEQLDKLELFKVSVNSTDDFHKKIIEILTEIRDLKSEQVKILKKQAQDNLTAQNRKLALREKEIKVAIRTNELKEYELGLRNQM